MEKKLICPKCGSENVNVQAVTTTHNKKHGLMWWLFVSWWIWLVWLFAFIPMAIISLIKGKKVISKTHSEAVCQACGKRWKI